MEQWMLSMKKADFKAIAARFNIDQVTARLIRNRDIISISDIDKYLNATLDELYSPRLMKNMLPACELISKKIKEGKSIRIIGDYDIDGITSTCILLKGLLRLGARADARIPDRITDGYGLNENLINDAHKASIDTILTCDNGIAAALPVQLAKNLGMTVIVTDHHEVPFDPNTKEQLLPPADIVVDPKQSDCTYPFKEICGAVIAWKLITLLYEMHNIPKAEAMEFLMLAAIATIGDVCELRDENRIIVKYGLMQLAKTSHPGLNALMSLNNIEPKSVSTYHIGFVIGPCLNASGRLETADKALDLLMTEKPSEAGRIASELININKSRKAMTEEYSKKAYDMVDKTDIKNDRVLIVYLPDCHESLAGIIAGRLKEKYNKPSFVLTDSENGIKGSGRSIDEYSMFEEMTKCKAFFSKFGGHPKAAGLSLADNDVEGFRRELNKKCTLTDADMEKKVHIDMTLPLGYISEELIKEFEKLQPFGVGNTRPLFAQKELCIINPSVIGKNKNAVRMTVSDKNGCRISGVYFGDSDEFMNYISNREEVSLIFYPAINEFRNTRTVQLNIIGYR